MSDVASLKWSIWKGQRLKLYHSNGPTEALERHSSGLFLNQSCLSLCRSVALWLKKGTQTREGNALFTHRAGRHRHRDRDAVPFPSQIVQNHLNLVFRWDSALLSVSLSLIAFRNRRQSEQAEGETRYAAGWARFYVLFVFLIDFEQVSSKNRKCLGQKNVVSATVGRIRCTHRVRCLYSSHSLSFCRCSPVRLLHFWTLFSCFLSFMRFAY